MIARLLIFVGLGWLIWQFLQKLQQPPPRQGEEDQRSSEPFQLTRRCAQCGTYLPAESLSKSGRCGRCSD